jgi:hydroxymethylpyrimidine/phosphomethylpyrimidine kinase
MKEKITVKEVKQIQPNADTYTLNVSQAYLIIVNKPKIQMIGQQSSISNAQKLQEVLVKHGISAIMIALDDNDEIKILELKRNLT